MQMLVKDGSVGVVVIGRNEGERLKRCLASVIPTCAQVVYVDSGSTDGSAQWARSQGVGVVDLDMTTPFTAARARNAGFHRLKELLPTADFVQFVDGDCEVFPTWPDTGRRFLQANPGVAAICGRLRERFPERSLYNMLCDMEWDAPAGESRATGGNAMIRVTAIEAVGGYREDLIAGEEPEMCVRMRALGWRVWRLAEDMAYHDAAMTRFGQWWRRVVRGGHAFAEGAYLHGRTPMRHFVPETRRAVLWGAALPVAIIGASLVQPWLLLGMLIYPAQVLRLALLGGIADRRQRWRALFLVLARFPEAQGVFKFWLGRLRDRRSALIEYK